MWTFFKILQTVIFQLAFIQKYKGHVTIFYDVIK